MKRATVPLLLSTPLLTLAATVALAASNPDQSFFRHAAQAGMAEVKDAQLAQEKSSNQAVKDFAARMIQDHTMANDQLMSIAAMEDVKLPSMPSVAETAEHAKLDVLTGEAFDKAYIRGQLKAHHQAIALFTKEAQSGQDQMAMMFAMQTLPTLKAHLRAARMVAMQLGIAAK